MTLTTKRKTSLTHDAKVLDAGKVLQINVSAVTEAALKSAVAQLGTPEPVARTQWPPLGGHQEWPWGATWNA